MSKKAFDPGFEFIITQISEKENSEMGVARMKEREYNGSKDCFENSRTPYSHN